MRTDIAYVVWGQKYTHLMLEYGLPSLLAEGNLPAWPYCDETILQIYTTAEDAILLQPHPVIQALQHHIQVQIHPVLAVTEASKHRLMNLGHQHVFAQAHQHQAALMLLAPDSVLASGGFSALQSFLQSGAELVLTLGPRVDMACLPELQSLKNEYYLSVPPAIATDMLIHYSHPATQALFWDADTFNGWNSQVYRYASPHTIVAQCFHLHPVFILHPQPYESVTITVDGEYLQAYDARREQVHIATDQQLFILSLTETTDNEFLFTPHLDQRQLLLDRFRRTFTAPIHRWFFKHEIVLQGTGTRAGGRPPQVACDKAIQAMQTFWALEEAFLADDWAQVTAEYSSQRDLLENHLPEMLTQVSQYYRAVAGA